MTTWDTSSAPCRITLRIPVTGTWYFLKSFQRRSIQDVRWLGGWRTRHLVLWNKHVGTGEDFLHKSPERKQLLRPDNRDRAQLKLT